MYPTYTDPIEFIMLAVWPHKYKVGHIDLILIKHHNLPKPPEIPEFFLCFYINIVKDVDRRIYFSYKEKY